MMKGSSDDGFLYSSNINSFESTILSVFEKTLEEMQKITDIEPKILQDLYRS